MALAVGAAVLFQGENIFNQTLRAYLAVNGVHAHSLKENATTIFYYEGGQENPRTVILLHGVGGNALSSWFRVLPKLAEKYHVIAPDLFFANLPDLIGSGYHVRFEQALVDNLMTELKIEKASLVGLSFGAWPALRTAMDRPERVERLVLVSPLDGSANTVLEKLDLDPDDPGKDFYYRIFESSPPVPSVFLWTHWDRTTAVFKALPFFRQQLDAEGRAIDKGLAKVRCPTLVLFGEHDRVIPAERFRLLADRVEDGRAVGLEDCGHAVVWDQSGRMGDAIEDFLDKGDI